MGVPDQTLTDNGKVEASEVANRIGTSGVRAHHWFEPSSAHPEIRRLGPPTPGQSVAAVSRRQAGGRLRPRR